MLTIVTFWWGDKYDISYVDKLASSIQRNMVGPYRFACLHDRGFPPFCDAVHHSWPIFDQELTSRQGCFARLRLFSPGWQVRYPLDPSALGQVSNDADQRIACIDLDAVITGSLDATFDRPEPFVILHGANAVNPCPYNGSLWMLRAGYRPDVWSGFSLGAAYLAPYHSFPDDQGWLWDKIPDAAGWRAGPESGIYAFKKPGWPAGDDLPSDARAVFFPGRRDPSQFTHLDWVQKHWRT